MLIFSRFFVVVVVVVVVVNIENVHTSIIPLNIRFSIVWKMIKAKADFNNGKGFP